MTIRYRLTEEDYMNLYMFLVSQTSRFIKQARTNRNIGMIAFALFAISFAIKFINIQSIVSLSICILCIIICVLFSKLYFLLYKSRIRREFKVKYGTIENMMKLAIDKDNFELIDNKGKYSMKTSDILSFTEVSDYFFIQMQKEAFIYIPKNQVQDVDGIKTELQEFSMLYNIPFREKPDWIANIYSKKSTL